MKEGLQWDFKAEVYAAGKTLLELAVHDYVDDSTFISRQALRAHGPSWGEAAIRDWLRGHLADRPGRAALEDVLLRTMWPNPRSRLSADGALGHSFFKRG